MYAVVKTGGKQIKVEEGTEAVVEKLNVAVGGSVDFEVLYYSDGDDRIADPGLLSDAKVTAEVLEHFKGDKVVVFKFKKRKGYKRTKGHRQQLTKVRVTGIAAPKGVKKVAAKPSRRRKSSLHSAKRSRRMANVAPTRRSPVRSTVVCTRKKIKDDTRTPSVRHGGRVESWHIKRVSEAPRTVAIRSRNV